MISAADLFVFIAPEDADQNTPGTSDTAEVTMVGDCLGIGSTIIFWPYGTRVVNLVPLTIDVPDLGPCRSGTARGRDIQPR